MRVSVATLLGPFPELGGPEALVTRLADLARRAEGLGYTGLWVTDSIGRGYPTLEAMTVLTMLSGTTSRLLLSTGVYQLPLRRSVDIAHRAQTVSVLSQGRFRLGVGAGSTRADFEIMDADFDDRFKTLDASIQSMQRQWSGEPVNGVTLTAWPGTAAPPIFVGAWRSERWIRYAAENCEGWVCSGLHCNWDDLEAGLDLFRSAGGRYAVLTNVLADMREVPSTDRRPDISLLCHPREARSRLDRLRDMGVDEVALMVPADAPDHVNQLSELF